MRPYIIAGNWKMNKNFEEADDFLYQLTEYVDENEEKLEGIDIVIASPYLYLEMATDYSENRPMYISAQNVSENEQGAYTGEISADMLESLDVGYCIVGHSERRKYYNETDKSVNLKIQQLQKNNIVPIVCIGESEEQRASGDTEKVLLTQLNGAFENILFHEDQPILIAYEPIWAIGTGKTATPEIAQETHAVIRNWLKEKYDQSISERVPILYGGSVKPGNIQELLSQKDIDGALIGGASLKIEDYTEMVNIAMEMVGK